MKTREDKLLELIVREKELKKELIEIQRKINKIEMQELQTIK